MPTMLIVAGYRFAIWPGDHLPPHVHAFKAGSEIVVLLEILEIRDAFGMAPYDQKQALAIASQHQGTLMQAWEKIHGH